jgi:serine/threonine protein kinase
MVTGRLPFQGDSPLSTVLKRFREDPASPRDHVPGLGPQWEATILRCLERDPRDRFASAREVLPALTGRRFPRRTVWRGGAWRRRLALAGAAGAVVLIVAGAYRWSRRAMPAASVP